MRYLSYPMANIDRLPPSPPAEAALQTLVSEHWGDRQLIHSRGFARHRPTPEQPWSRAASPGSSLQAALATGNVELRPNAVVSHLMFDPDTHRASGVAFVDRLTQTAHEVRAQLVVLCASAIESVRILLHSTADHQPHGLPNESGILGRYLMDHVSTTQFFWLPGVSKPGAPFPLSGSESFFIPRFCNLDAPQSESFLRGYGLWGGIQRIAVPPVLQKVGEGAIGFLVGHGEVLPRPENRVSLSPDTVDAWGIPAAHIDCAWSDNEHQMVAHMSQEIQATVEAAGGAVLRPYRPVPHTRDRPLHAPPREKNSPPLPPLATTSTKSVAHAWALHPKIPSSMPITSAGKRPTCWSPMAHAGPHPGGRVRR